MMISHLYKKLISENRTIQTQINILFVSFIFYLVCLKILI